MPIGRGTFLCLAAAFLFLLLACEIGAKEIPGKREKRSYNNYNNGYGYPYPGHPKYSGKYVPGLIDEDMPRWKLALIICAIIVVGLCGFCICQCMKAKPSPRQEKVDEFLQLQEAQRTADVPGQPQPMPMPMPYPNGNVKPPSPDWRVPPSSEVPMIPYPVTNNTRDVEPVHIGWTFNAPSNQGVEGVSSNGPNFPPVQTGADNSQPTPPQQ